MLYRLADALLHPEMSPAAEPALRCGILRAISEASSPEDSWSLFTFLFCQAFAGMLVLMDLRLTSILVSVAHM